MKLRPYRSYRPSGVEWIGAVPEHWMVAGLKRRYDIQLGKMLQTRPRSVDDVEVRYFRARNVQWFEVEATAGSWMWASLEELDRFRVLPGDLLVCEGGEGGRCAILERMDAEHIIQNALHRVRPRGLGSNRCLQYVLRAAASAGWLESLNDKATIAHLTREKLGALRIPHAPPSEQASIACFLDHADRRIRRSIRAKESLIELLDEQKQGIIHQAVTGQIDVRTGQPYPAYKQSGVEWLGEVPEHWDVLPLKRWVSTKITDGPHKTPDFLPAGVPFLSAEAVSDGRLDFSRRRGFISQEIHEMYCRKCRPQRDDIFMCKSGATTGKVAMVETDDEFSVWSPLALIRVDAQRVIAKLLFRVLQSRYLQGQVRDTWSYGTQPNLAMRAMERLVIALPPLDEQRAILGWLNGPLLRSYRTADLARREIELVHEYRTRLIADVVTGKLDVREAAAILPDIDPLIAQDAQNGTAEPNMEPEGALQHSHP